MFEFKLNTPIGSSAVLLFAGLWSEPNRLVIAAAPDLKAVITDHINTKGRTPYGEIIDVDNVSPMDIDATFSDKQISKGWSIELITGEAETYPPKYSEVEVNDFEVEEETESEEVLLDSVGDSANIRNVIRFVRSSKTFNSLLKQVDATIGGQLKIMDALIETALSNKEGNKEFVISDKVSSKEAATIKQKTGLDLEGYEHVISESAIRHINNDHGFAGGVDHKFEIPLTKDDIRLIPLILADPDDIRDTKSANGKPGVTYTKNIAGTIHYVEEIVESNNRGQRLIAKTMWKTATYKKIESMSAEEVKAEIDEISIRSGTRQQEFLDKQFNKNMYFGENPQIYMTKMEIARMHELKQALPSSGRLALEAKERNRKRIAARKKKKSDEELYDAVPSAGAQRKRPKRSASVQLNSMDSNTQTSKNPAVTLFLDASSYTPTVKKHTFKLDGNVVFQGMPISIENYAGKTRKGVDPHGKKWSIKMRYSYGYITGTVSADDHEGIDVYLGKDKKAKHAYIVKQHKIEKVSKWGSEYCPDCEEHAKDCSCPQYFDEDKVMLGFKNRENAIQAYLKQYDSPLFLGPVSTMTVDEFKKAVMTNKKKPKSLPYQLAPKDT